VEIMLTCLQVSILDRLDAAHRAHGAGDASLATLCDALPDTLHTTVSVACLRLTELGFLTCAWPDDDAEYRGRELTYAAQLTITESGCAMWIAERRVQALIARGKRVGRAFHDASLSAAVPNSVRQALWGELSALTGDVAEAQRARNTLFEDAARGAVSRRAAS
jgi:hypothetical protein